MPLLDHHHQDRGQRHTGIFKKGHVVHIAEGKDFLDLAFLGCVTSVHMDLGPESIG